MSNWKVVGTPDLNRDGRADVLLQSASAPPRAKTPFGFVGKAGYYSDEESGLQLLGHRYYLPKLGRFLTQDPTGFEGGLNLYRYVGDNPLTGIDPDGTSDNTVLEKSLMRRITAMPVHPKNADIFANIAQARRHFVYMASALYGGPHGMFQPWEDHILLDRLINSLRWFYYEVRSKGPWDYKLRSVRDKQGKILTSYEDFGNFNYGATGAALGLDLEVLLKAAGGYQVYEKHSRPEWGNPLSGPPYGDDPKDQAQIRAGYELATDYLRYMKR